MNYIEFSKDLNKAGISLSIGTNLEESETHVLVGLSQVTNECVVGDCGEKVEADAPFFGLLFFHKESIDALIKTLNKAKEILCESEGNT